MFNLSSPCSLGLGMLWTVRTGCSGVCAQAHAQTHTRRCARPCDSLTALRSLRCHDITRQLHHTQDSGRVMMNQDFSGTLPKQYAFGTDDAAGHNAPKTPRPGALPGGHLPSPPPPPPLPHRYQYPLPLGPRQVPCSCAGASAGDDDGCRHEHGAGVCVACQEAAVGACVDAPHTGYVPMGDHSTVWVSTPQLKVKVFVCRTIASMLSVRCGCRTATHTGFPRTCAPHLRVASSVH